MVLFLHKSPFSPIKIIMLCNGSGVLKNVEHKGVNNNVNKGGRRQLKDWIKDGGSKDVGSKDGGSKDGEKDGGNKGGKGKRS